MPRIRWTPEEDERLLDLINQRHAMKSVKLHAKKRLKAEQLTREAAGTPVAAKKAKTKQAK